MSRGRRKRGRRSHEIKEMWGKVTKLKSSRVVFQFTVFFCQGETLLLEKNVCNTSAVVLVGGRRCRRKLEMVSLILSEGGTQEKGTWLSEGRRGFV